VDLNAIQNQLDDLFESLEQIVPRWHYDGMVDFIRQYRMLQEQLTEQNEKGKRMQREIIVLNEMLDNVFKKTQIEHSDFSKDGRGIQKVHSFFRFFIVTL